MTNKANKKSNDYDSPWKEALEAYFPEFIQLLFPKAYAEINWSKPHEFLDNELQKVVRDADSGRKYTDKLVKVYTLAGNEIWVLIHIEIQGKADQKFNERMYHYHYRLIDRYPNHKITSFAILTNQPNCRHLGRYQYSQWKMQMNFRFPVINLQSYRHKMRQLRENPNPFSIVILAQLIAHNTQNNQSRFTAKFNLIRSLYHRGYQKQDVLELFRFIDWMLQLPEDLELQLTEDMVHIEEEQKMAYITNIERFAIAKGEARGEIMGEIKILLKLLHLKFNTVPEWVEKKIISADKKQLDLWVEKIMTTDTLDNLFE